MGEKILRNRRSCVLISYRDKVEYPFEAYSEADEFLERRHGYIRSCLRNGNRLSKLHEDGSIEYFEIIEGPKNKKSSSNERMQDQLCWRCGNACGGCSWSREFEPVPGWIAIPTFKDRSDTYCIIKCPDFKPEKRG